MGLMSMDGISTEEMVMQIQNGDRSVLPALWERLERLFFVIVKKYTDKRIMPVWASQDDFIQGCYIALYKAVEQYRPDKGHSFTTYLGYHVRNMVNDQLGTRNGKKQIIPISGDVPIGEDNESTILGQIPDHCAALAFENAEENCFQGELHRALEECLATLPVEQERIIRERYYEGLTLPEIAKRSESGIEAVRRQISKALQGLRKPVCRRKLEPFLLEISAPFHVGFSTFQNTWTSQPERAAEATFYND